PWYPHRRPQAAKRAVAHKNVAAMGPGDVAGDREAEASAAVFEVARHVEPMERAEHRLALLDGDARAVIVDMDLEPAAGMARGDRDRIGVADGVGDEVADAAAEGEGAQHHLWAAHDRKRDRAAGAELFHDALKERGDSGRNGLLAAVAAGKGKVFLEHPLHV